MLKRTILILAAVLLTAALAAAQSTAPVLTGLTLTHEGEALDLLNASTLTKGFASGATLYSADLPHEHDDDHDHEAEDDDDHAYEGGQGDPPAILTGPQGPDDFGALPTAYSFETVDVAATWAAAEGATITVVAKSANSGGDTVTSETAIASSGASVTLSLATTRTTVTVTITDTTANLSTTYTIHIQEPIVIEGPKDWYDGSNAISELSGTDGDDTLTGGAGNDALDGKKGKDELRGLGGHDTLSGGRGNDKLYGGPGDDGLNGGRGNDKLYGGPGDDELNGGRDNDRLYGGTGNDTLTGGGGRDRYVFVSGDSGRKIITDFGARELIVLKGGGWETVANIIATVQATGSADYTYTLSRSGEPSLTVKTNRALDTNNFSVTN